MKTAPIYYQGSHLLETIVAFTISALIAGILYLASAIHIRNRVHVDQQLLLAEHTLLLYHITGNIIHCDKLLISPTMIDYHCQADNNGMLFIDKKQCALLDKSDKITRVRKRLSHICAWALQLSERQLVIHTTICLDPNTCISPILRFNR